MSVGASVAEAYSATGAAAWQWGPGPVYDRLAPALVDGVRGRVVLDVGAGTGAVGRAALAAGARRVVGVDVAAGMAPDVVGDAARLPFAGATFGAVVAAFSLNHLPDPVPALRECARVGRAVTVASFALDDDHPVKHVVESVLAERGWTEPGWYAAVKASAMPRLATVARAVAAARAAGVVGAVARRVSVPLPDLTPLDLVRWRLGMAQAAPHLDDVAALEQACLARLGDPPPLVRRLVVLRWTRPGPSR